MPETESRAAKIRRLNDLFRQTGLGGRVLLTQGINALPEDEKQDLIARVRMFDDFTEANDPYGEHDFGILPISDGKAYFKIDYYNADATAGSEDPADPWLTARVMTIMLSQEY